MSEKSAVWKTMPLATAVIIAIDKRQGVLIDDELITILSNEFGEVSPNEINQVLMDLEIRGLIHVSQITKNKRRIERITEDKAYMAVGED
jgi:DNA-binding PadR family transcriptional regulator